MHVQRGSRRGFTLVELLVVLAIIALLIALIFPTLGAARRQSRVVACESNLHQLGVALRMYMVHNDGKWISPTDDWPIKLNPYLGPTQKDNVGVNSKTAWVLRCPEAWEKNNTNAIGGAFEPWYYKPGVIGAYGMIYRQEGDTTARIALRGNKRFPVFFDCARVTLNVSPTDTFATGGMSSIAMRRHYHVANIALADGSVHSVQLPELWKLDWSPTWLAPNPLPRMPW